MILTDCDIDRNILFKYLKQYTYNVHDNIFKINTWKRTFGDSYTMSIDTSMEVNIMETHETEIILKNEVHFSITVKKFDKFYEKELRNQKINDIVYGSN